MYFTIYSILVLQYLTMNSPEIMQLIPEKGSVPLASLYIDSPYHHLHELSRKKDGPVVISNFVVSANGIIAVEDTNGNSHPPDEILNSSDWQVFQNVNFHADVIITGGDYLTRFSKGGTQNVLTQFEEGGDFEGLGLKRLAMNLPRSPAVAVVSRSLKFEIPKVLLDEGRQIIIFTTDKMAGSEAAKAFGELPNVTVVPVGDENGEGVDGKKMVDELYQMGHKVIKMTTGPQVLEILLKAKVLDRLYLTRVRREVPVKKYVSVTRLFPEGQSAEDLAGFTLSERYLQQNVETKDGETASQEFLVFDSNDFLSSIKSPTSV